MGSEARPIGDDPAVAAATRFEQLNYLADMVGELREIAAREGCVTLTGLLALAEVEAQNQARQAKSPV